MRVSAALFAAPIVAAALFAAAPAAMAAPYTLDKSHAAITFEVDHFGYSLTQFRFNAFDADVDFDPENPANSKVSVTIDAASIDSNWPARDEHVRSADFLNVAAHPTIDFVSKSIVMDGADKATLTGDLTMNGVTREETFAVTLRKVAPHPMLKKEAAGFSASGVIDRTNYGVETYAGAIGTKIPVTINLEIIAQ